VTCTAHDSAGDAEPLPWVQVTVQDTTPPAISTADITDVPATSASGAVVSFNATFTDLVDGTIPASSCTPTSGSTFPVGTTEVDCTATDNAGNPGHGSFHVTVDPFVPADTPPTMTVTGPTTVEATGPGGGPLTYSASASDPDTGDSATFSCDLPVGTLIPVDGSKTVTCTATDTHGEQTPAQLTQSAVDTTPPTVTVPSNITANPTSANGAVVTFSASASDLVDGSLMPTCNPPSGSAFPLGANGTPGVTTVTCSATDSHHNTGSNSFSVTVQAPNAPVVSVPASEIVEANGPNGSVVNYPSASAVDAFGQPLVATCTPASGTLFPIGKTQVTCTAKDSLGHVGQAAFTVTVEDTTPPELTVPADLSIQSATAIPVTDPTIAKFLSGAVATDIVDPKPKITVSAPSSFPVGTTSVTFTATDASGNSVSKVSKVTIGPDVQNSGGSTDRVPPGNVTNVKATIGNLRVTITWNNSADSDHVNITRTSVTTARTALAAPAPKLVYSGKGTKYVDKGLTNSVQYRYVIVAVDKAGNRASGVAVIALAQRQTILSPASGAVVSRAPRIAWQKFKGASYYNLQLWLGSAKMLSVWPNVPAYQLKARWTYKNVSRALKPGTYTVYVWPGFGKLSAGKYGSLIGQSTFTFKR